MSCYSFHQRLLALLFGSLLCLQAQSAVISATATDVADTTASEDLWQLRYQITGALPSLSIFIFTLDAAVYGSPALVEPIAAPVLAGVTPGGPAFDSGLTVGVDRELADGESVSFDLLFTRLGDAPFGPQAYELYDGFLSFSDSVSVQVTTPTNDVPEPATWALLSLGVAMLGRPRGRRAPPALTAPA